MHQMKTCKSTDCGVSEIIGAVLLISVVVVAVAIIGVALTSQGTSQKIPALDAIISNYGNKIQNYHNGGDTLQSSDIKIYVDGNPTTFKKGDTDPARTSWSPGDSLVTDLTTTPRIVSIIYSGASGFSTVLTTADFTPAGMNNAGPVVTNTLSAAFAATPSSGTPPLVVQFIDQSTGSPVSWNWNFGDGTSTGKNPTHVYNSAGTYNVVLVVTNSTGSTASITHPVLVSANSPTVSGVSPGQGVQGTSVPISVFGTNFASGATITPKNQSTTIPASSVVFVSATTLTGTVVIPPGATLGPWNVIVTNPDMQIGTLTNGFTISPAGPTFTSISPTNGPTGGSTPVTITGTNLIGATSVTFDSIAATGVSVVNATSITATTPAHAAGVVNVVVTTPNGTATGTGMYTYGAGVPSVTSVTPPSGTTLGGTSVKITGTNLIGASIVAFDGIAATGVSVLNVTSVRATTPAHAAGLVNVVVITPNGTVTGTNVYTYKTPLTAISAITGTPRVGSILTAGALSPAGATASYEWQRSTILAGPYTAIAGATATTYTPVAGDATYFIRVNATGTGDYIGTVSSAAVGPVVKIPLTAIAAITGTPRVGSVLTAGALTPAGATATYAWQRSTLLAGPYTAIAGATTTTYTPVAGDATYYIRVNTTGTGDYTGTVSSAAVGPVVKIPITAIGAITGTPQVGSLLTSGAVTPAGATVTYQWQRSTTAGGTYSAISGATATTYTPVAGDATYYIRVNATGTGSYTGTISSAVVGPVQSTPTITSLGGGGTPTSGARGTTVTGIRINGANYITSPVPTVTFTRVGAPTLMATVTAVTATRVTVSVVIPAGQPTGLYSVTVTNTDGGTVTRANSFTVT